MKLRSIAILAAVLIMTVSMAMEWPKSKKTVNISKPTLVGSVTLEAGDYTIDWSGTAPEVQVSFSREGKTIATVPATLEAAQNREESLVTSEPQDSGSAMLLELNLKNSTLRFVPQATGSGS